MDPQCRILCPRKCADVGLAETCHRRCRTLFGTTSLLCKEGELGLLNAIRSCTTNILDTRRTHLRLLRCRHSHASDTLRDSGTEQTFLIGCDKMQFDRCTTGTLSVDCDAFWIAAEGADVFLYPAKCFGLVLETGVVVSEAGRREGWVGEETEGV